MAESPAAPPTKKRPGQHHVFKKLRVLLPGAWVQWLGEGAPLFFKAVLVARCWGGAVTHQQGWLHCMAVDPCPQQAWRPRSSCLLG